MSRVGILVHGTFAAPKPDVKQWYQGTTDEPDSFVSRLDAALISRGETPPTKWHVFTWSGGNTHADRASASEDLFKLLQDLLSVSPGSELIMIAHSHGGNVALKALELLWRRNPEARNVFRELLLNSATFGAVGADRARALAASGWYGRNISDDLRSYLVQVQLPIDMLTKVMGKPHPLSEQSRRELWAEKILRAKIMRSILEVFSIRWSVERRPRVHLVTMGTPFFEKVWHSRRINLSTRRSIAAMVTVIVSGLGLMIVASLQSVSPMTYIILIILSIGLFGGFSFMLYDMMARMRHDTNIYFNLPRDLPHFEKKPWRLSAFQAGFLDEALLALSAEPLLRAELVPLLRRPFGPRLSWTASPDSAGEMSYVITISPQNYVRLAFKSLGLIARWIYNLTIGAVLRVLGWIGTVATRGLLLRTLLRSISSAGFGIPEQEFRRASVKVVPMPSLDMFFEQEAWDATIALVDEPAARPTADDRKAKWGFLWDDDLLRRALPSSQLWKRISKGTCLQAQPHATQGDAGKFLQRLTIATEERIREAAGLVPLNHSAYYMNKQVIEKIADFLSGNR